VKEGTRRFWSFYVADIILRHRGWPAPDFFSQLADFSCQLLQAFSLQRPIFDGAVGVHPHLYF
jgi:hypothetical protein